MAHVNVSTCCVEKELSDVQTPGVTATPGACGVDSPSSPSAVIVIPPRVVAPSALLVYPGGAV